MASESHPVAYEELPFASTDGRYGSAHSTMQCLKRKLGSLIKDFLALSSPMFRTHFLGHRSPLSYDRLGFSIAGGVNPMWVKEAAKERAVW
jgi:hypothetical protein